MLEDKYRFSVFSATLRKIEEHNARYAKGLESYFLKITQFADMTDEEFADEVLCFRKPRVNYTTKFALEKGKVVPKAIDWRSKGAVLEVKNQRNCGSCYAFSTVS